MHIKDDEDIMEITQMFFQFNISACSNERFIYYSLENNEKEHLKKVGGIV